MATSMTVPAEYERLNLPWVPDTASCTVYGLREADKREEELLREMEGTQGEGARNARDDRIRIRTYLMQFLADVKSARRACTELVLFF